MIALALALVTALAHVPKPVAMGTSWTAAQLAHLRSDVERTLASAPTLRGAHVGFIALETASGRVLFERGADDAFMPASTFKVLTGSAALQKLGPSFTFKTQVALAGDGRLVLRGGGDAQLSPSDLDAAAAAVAAAGVGTIDEIDGDASYFERAAYLPGWMVDDVPFYFAPALTSLCLDGNVVHLTVTPGTSAGARAGFSAIPNATLSIDNRVTTGAAKTASTVDVSREGATIVLVGSIPLEAAPEKVDAAVPDPSAYAIDIFTQALLAHGVDVAPTTRVRTMNEPVPAQRLLWSHDSAPLPQVLHDFWYRSDNLIGEMLLKSLGVARSGAPGTSESGAVLEAEWLRTLGIDPAQMDVSDGSGLSGYDRISPRTLVRLLQYDWHGANREAVLDALPVIDFKGTPAAGRVFAKTGTRRYARGLAGFVRPRRHGAVTFALLVDDWFGEDEGMRDLRARLLSRLVQD